MNKLEELIAEEERLEAEYGNVRERLQAAQQAVLVERFKDYEQYHEGDIILVPRKLFGEKKMWPAKIQSVHLDYSFGHYPESYKANPGGFWEFHNISYTVFLKQKDGSFSGSTEGVYHRDVKAA